MRGRPGAGGTDEGEVRVSLDAWSVLVPVLLGAVFVPLLRGCGWRTAGALALVFATMTASGPAWEWQHVLYEVSADATPPRGVNISRGEDGPRGTQKPFFGELVVVLGVAAVAASFLVTISSERATPGGMLLIALAAAILLGLASVWTLYEILAHARAEPVHVGEGLSLLPIPSFGIRLTLLAGVLGTVCAARALALLRTAPDASTSPGTP